MVRSLSAQYEGRRVDVLPQRGGGSGGKAREHAGNTGGSGADRERGWGEKQDCGWNAEKGWLGKYGKEYAWLSPTLSGDDLYANRPFCKAVLKEKPHFIFACRPGSHPWLYETVGNSYVKEKTAERLDGRIILAAPGGS
jgi:hypothetical protein